MTARMILVSNRLPVTVTKCNGKFQINKSSGGLVAGLREIHQGADCLWVGHCGIYANEPGYADLKQQLAEQRLIAVDLTQDQYEDYYNGASNNEVWPLFHYFPEAIDANPNNWPAYRHANQAFAATVLAETAPGDQVWVHDYQLMMLPGLLRQANPDLAIAYFHHIPFPSSELFRILSARQEILQGLLGADLIGFHTYDYVRHFLTSVSRILGCHIHLDEVSYLGRRIKVVAQPLGVDVNMIRESSENYVEHQDVMRLAHEIGNRTVLLGVDRLDYTKGIPERLLAFRQLLQQYPQHIGNITLIQVCVPTRANIPRYMELRAKVEQLVGQINGEFGAPGYTPVQYLYRSFTQDETIAFYKLARVAIVTPLRDGLNLVCKEYIAARDDDDGVLILSEMAGAAVEMGEALLINPYDINQFAEALHSGLTMKAVERHHRAVQLRKRIIEFDNMAWLRAFIQHWADAVQRNHIHSIPLRHGVYENLFKRIAAANRCFIFLDYDGSLISSTATAQPPIPTAESLQLFSELGSLPQIELTLMTNRSKDFCMNYFSHLPMNVAAEHGAFIQLRDEKFWHAPYGLDEFYLIEPDIIRLLERYTRHVPGTCIERKQFSIAWDYQRANAALAGAQARDLSAAIAQLLEHTLFGIYHQHKILEIRPLIANKGYAMEQVLHHRECQPEHLLMTIGDDESDEEMYKLRKQQNIAIHVGAPNLFANFHLTSPNDIRQLLKKIVDGFEAITAPQ
jgi:trehalose 6-phosphate synthase/phosphatase